MFKKSTPSMKPCRSLICSGVPMFVYGVIGVITRYFCEAEVRLPPLGGGGSLPEKSGNLG